MNGSDLGQLALYIGAVVLLSPPLGRYMAWVFNRRADLFERTFLRAIGAAGAASMSWRTYAVAMLLFNAAGLGLVYLIQRTQAILPLNPAGMQAVPRGLALNTAISFVTNTNWQAYGGESTLSYLTQMLALSVQNFLSAATGIAVLVALIRGFVSHTSDAVGNFWSDLWRSIWWILLPLSMVLAIVLVSQGVVQTFAPYATANPLEASPSATASIALGPVASQIAIKQLGTNGGGYYNANSAHPLENPTPLSNFLEMLAILIIPAGLCFTFGRMVSDRRQGRAVFVAMLAIVIPLMMTTIVAESRSNPVLSNLNLQPGGNMEGKEVRFGVVNSAIWATATTAASNGSVNAMHDSFMPLGGLVPLWLIQLGEVVFGGVGSGLYGMLLFAIVAVFVAGLMVGRTPEYLGKKIEAFEMKMAGLAILLPSAMVLVGTAVAVATVAGRAGVFNPGPQGFSEVLYAFSSAANNNGSAFGGLGANSAFYNLALGLAMLVGRFGVAIPVLAIAGSLAIKRRVPPSSGTLPTHGPLFVLLLIGSVVLVGALTFVPSLALGPIVEHLRLLEAH
ncbi:MAG: potassium-transporting ATPase subunit KdpA [Acidobacteriota bacterium]